MTFATTKHTMPEAQERSRTSTRALRRGRGLAFPEHVREQVVEVRRVALGPDGSLGTGTHCTFSAVVGTLHPDLQSTQPGKPRWLTPPSNAF